ncbi:type II secretion system secretin GspD [Endozoicomonas sp. Mp262]|uniref:type II secretion system secretin GspD n=1 Tax=Endozoicomonas sp. Mp262 TaxID=2919499 RepID=UPI0021E0B07B
MTTSPLTARTVYKQLFHSAMLSLIICGHAFAEAAAPATAAIPQNAKAQASTEKRWALNQQNADIREFIAQIAKITEETFVIDPRIKGGNTVTVISSKPLTRDQVYDVFLEVLTANGYTVIPKGRIMNIVPSTTAKTSSGHGQEKPRDAIMTTKVIELHSVSSVEVIPIIRPLIAQYGHAAASASSNAVIVSDLADNVERISKLVKELDEASNNDYEVLQLKHAWVGDVAKIIQDTLITGKGQLPAGLQVIADELSNRLVVKGNASKRARVRKLVETLDREGIRKSTTKVMFLSYGDAKNLAEILSEASDTIQDTQAKKGQGQPPSQPQPPTSSRSQGKQSQTKTDGKGSKLAKNIFVKADETQNALVMIADPDTLKTMEQIVRQLDRPRAQVLLEAAIVEVTGGINDALGIQWGIDGRNTKANRGGTDDQIGSGSLSSITGEIVKNTSLNLGTLALRDKNFGVLVHALSTKTNNNILSTPSLLTLDNQEAEFLVGENIPIKTGSYQTSSQKDSTNPFTTTERKDIGIKLKITPHLSEKNSLRLELEQEISTRRSSEKSTDDIIYDNRTLKTTIIVDDGQTIVIGGLLQDDRSKSKNKVPLLGDIPILGNLFKYDNHRTTKRNLMLFVRPTIMRNSETLANASQNRFSKLKLLQKNSKEAPSDHFPASPDDLFLPEAVDLREQGKPAWTN